LSRLRAWNRFHERKRDKLERKMNGTVSLRAKRCAEEQQDSLSRNLPRAAPKPSVLSRGGRLGRTRTPTTDPTQFRRHPSRRSTDTRNKGGQVDIGVEQRKVQPQARGRYLDRRKRVCRGFAQPLNAVRCKREFNPAIEAHDDAPTATVVACTQGT